MKKNPDCSRSIKPFIDLCLSLSGQYSAGQYFRWCVDLALSTMTGKPNHIPSDEMDRVEQLLKCYELILDKNKSDPFADVLGQIYMDLGSQGKSLGQYFTPRHIARLMAEINAPIPSGGNIIRICEPTVGSGVMCLAMCEVLLRRDPEILPRLSFTCIDLDSLCVNMAIVQLLAVAQLVGSSFAELAFYRGNTLGPLDELDLVLHAVNPALTSSAEILEDKDRRKMMGSVAA